jgi:hypothetical protein
MLGGIIAYPVIGTLSHLSVKGMEISVGSNIAVPPSFNDVNTLGSGILAFDVDDFIATNNNVHDVVNYGIIHRMSALSDGRTVSGQISNNVTENTGRAGIHMTLIADSTNITYALSLLNNSVDAASSAPGTASGIFVSSSGVGGAIAGTVQGNTVANSLAGIIFNNAGSSSQTIDVIGNTVTANLNRGMGFTQNGTSMGNYTVSNNVISLNGADQISSSVGIDASLNFVNLSGTLTNLVTEPLGSLFSLYRTSNNINGTILINGITHPGNTNLP